jgi:hypothetical protein
MGRVEKWITGMMDLWEEKRPFHYSNIPSFHGAEKIRGSIKIV